MKKILWVLAVGSLVACGSDDPDDTTVTADAGTTDSDDPDGGRVSYDLVVNETQVGIPTWSIVGVEMFVAPFNVETAKCLLEPNHRYDGSVWLPNTVHEEPYDDEFTDAVDACGFPLATTVTGEEFSPPNGIFLGIIIQGSADGSTPDYESGAFIATEKFPMVVDGDVRRDLVIVDNDQDRTYPDPISLGYFVDGHSHVPLLFQMNMARMPAGATPPGNYSFRLAIRDATSQIDPTGYDVEVPFTVVE